MPFHREILDDLLSLWTDEPVHEFGCHPFVRPERTNEGMRGIEQRVVFIIGACCLFQSFRPILT